MTVNNLKPNADSPSTAFGEVSVANLTPAVQIQFPYNINSELVTTRLNNGSAAIDSNRLKLSTGASANQSAQMFTVTPVKYNTGQGGLVRFTTIYTKGKTGSTQIMGVVDY